MNKKFECWTCGKRFEADPSKYVECPYCHSDNVEFSTFHLSKYKKTILWSVCVIVILAISFIVLKTLNEETPINKQVSIIDNDSIAIESFKNDSTFLSETGLSKPMSLSAQTPVFTEDGYYVFVSSNDAPNTKFVFHILEAFEDKVVSTSYDGIFKNIPPSASEGGSYRIVAVCTVNDSILASIDVPGFIQQKRVSNKMSAAELQEKIKQRDPSLLGTGENDYLAPQYSLSFEGLSSGAVNVPKVLAEVFEKIDNGAWLSVNIVSLGYDDMNRINSMKISVKEED